MRGLLGDFQTMPLSDLVVYLGNRQSSGTLSLERGAARKQVSIRQGMILNASSNEPREYLGQFLINMGHITEDQFNRAYETQKETRILLGKILVMIGAVSEQDVKTALSLKFRETLLEAFNWTDGFFNFDATTEPIPPEGLDLVISLLDVHREGEFRQTAWEAIRAAFPSGAARLELAEEKIVAPPKPGSIDERLFSLIREGRSLDEILLALHATDFFLYQRLYALLRAEVVHVAKAGDPEVLLLTTELVEPLESFDGFELAEPELEPEDLLAHLRRMLVEGNRTPTLLVSPQQLKSMQLSAPERYLLSRVDGRRRIANIIQVSPLRELDALKHFRRFLEAGLVRIE